MAKTARLRVSDFRSILHLVGECRELGDEAWQWRPHLIAGLARLTGAGVGVSGEIAIDRRGPRHDLGIADWGFDAGFDRSAWLNALATFQHNPLYNPIMNAYVARLSEIAGGAVSRGELIPDGEWYRSAYYQNIHRALGADVTLACFCPVPSKPAEFSEVFLARGVGEGDFGEREKRIVREAHATVAPLVGGPLARFVEPSPADLPPRTRQVLRCLLEGDSDKQVASRLGMSGYTVNGHTKAIYAHFGVSGRADLLARWVRRGWSSRCAWADLT